MVPARVSSYRAEGYGALSLLRFLFQVSQFCDIPLRRVMFSALCDNEVLVTNLKDLMHLLEAPGSTLSSDWDILIEIKHALDELGTEHKTSHIKSLPDDDTPYEELSLSTQQRGRRRDCGKLSGRIRRSTPNSSNDAPTLPSATACSRRHSHLQVTKCNSSRRHRSRIIESCWPAVQLVFSRRLLD